MNRNRLLILVGAIGIGLASGFAVFSSSGTDSPISPEKIVERVVIDSVEVLVTKNEIPPAGLVEPSALVWQAWPMGSASGLITRSNRPNAIEELGGALARTALAAGEPIRQDKLLEKGSRFMSVMLAPGKRAIAIPLDQNGGTAAGGFVLPNDYVDVVRVESSTQRSGSSQTILTNVRVLAIGPNVGEKSDEKVALGQTATLELDPEQAEFLIAAMQGASLHLALRGIAESGAKDKAPEANALAPARTIIRAGVPSTF
jgi:pilus assembly protein CpaB